MTQTQNALHTVFLSGKTCSNGGGKPATHFASRLRYNPKMRLRSVLLRLHTETSGPPQEAYNQSPRSTPEDRACRRRRGRPLRCYGRRNLDTGVVLLHACNAIAPQPPPLAPRAVRSASLPRARAPRPPLRQRQRWDNRESSARRNRWSSRRRAARECGW